MSQRLTFPAVLALFVALACVMTFPLVRVGQPALPDSDDAYFSVWRLAWVSHQLAIDPRDLFDANIFFPADNTLAYSDAMLAMGFLAWPAIAAGVPPAIVHNVLILAAFVTSGVAAFLLCRELSRSRAAAILGGVVFAFAPFRFAHIGHLELLWTAPMPLAVLVLHRALTRPRPLAHGVALGMLVALQALCSVYYAVFLVIFLALWTLAAMLLSRAERVAAFLAVLGIAGAVSLAIVAPYARPYAQARSEVGPRSPEEIRTFSATPGDYLRVSMQSKVYPPGPREAQDERSLFPGVVAIALAVAAVIQRRDRIVWLYAVLTVVAFDLSLGLNGVSYRVLGAVVPALDGLRAPARFSSLVLLCLAVLAAMGLAAITRGRSVRARGICAGIAIVIAIAEYWCAPISVRPAIVDAPAAYRWVAEHRPALIVELPMPAPSALWYYESTHEYMSIFHWAPLVNGYSGHAPKAYIDTLGVMQTFPSRESIAHLRILGVSHVIVHDRFYQPGAVDALVVQMKARPDFATPIRLPDPVDPAWVFPVIGD